MNSCLYECEIVHDRLRPRRHRFRHRIFLLAVDLEELDELDRRLVLFSRNRPNLFSFRDRDHLTLPDLADRPIRDHLAAWVGARGETLPGDARIVLVTLPRVFGYVFNPVSFYFCISHAGQPLWAVAEVGNTFREMKPYLIPRGERPGEFRRRTPKHFYVSPFSSVDLDFDFRLRLPGEKLEARIDDEDPEGTVLRSFLAGTRADLSDRRLLWFAVKYPLLTLQVIFLIHWHALELWIKRLPWHRKAENAGRQVELFTPTAGMGGRK